MTGESAEDPRREAVARAASDAYLSARTAALRIAEAGGAQVREKPAFPGAVSTIRYADPLAGILAAVTVRNAAGRVVGDYVKYARSDGASWGEIGAALGLEDPDRSGCDLAVAAYEQAAGEPDLWHQPAYYFPCGTCGQVITDRGPYEANPRDVESGHAGDCARLAEAVRKYEEQWGEE